MKTFRGVASEKELAPPAEIQAQVLKSLDSTGLPYEVVKIDPAFADTAQFCANYGFPPEQSANTIIVATKKIPRQFTASVVRATVRLNVNHCVKRLMGNQRVSFADAEDTVALTGMIIGGVTALALPEEVQVFVDPGLMDLDYIILGAGSRSAKIKVSPEVFNHIPNALVVENLVIA